MRDQSVNCAESLDFVISGAKTCNFIKDLMMLMLCLHNLAQNTVDKFMLLSDVDFFMDCFTGDFSQFSRRLGSWYLLKAFHGISSNILVSGDL